MSIVKNDIQEMLKIQAGSLSGEYMYGLYNGLEIALSIIEKRDPKFKVVPKKESK